jgi:hypothetical protein
LIGWSPANGFPLPVNDDGVGRQFVMLAVACLAFGGGTPKARRAETVDGYGLAHGTKDRFSLSSAFLFIAVLSSGER